MEKLLLQAVIVTTFMINFSLSARRFGIMYGEETDIQKFPYQVVYRANGTFRCGGSIINGDCIVTAAHCVVGYPKNISVRAGSSLRSSGGVVIPVKQAINHPEYDQKTLLNDVAVLKLSESFEFNDVIQPIALNCDEVSDDTECIVSGWGRTESGKSSETLRSVTLHTINKETCQINYNDKRVKYRLPSSSLCAGVSQVDLKGQNQTKDSCSGDSGGPLVANGEQIGIVSAGYDCGKPDFPGLYTKASTMCEWIKKTCELEESEDIEELFI